jgi:hypothetical protein
VKFNIAPKIICGFYQACEDVQATREFVVYSGHDEFLINHTTTIISLQRLMLRLQK